MFREEIEFSLGNISLYIFWIQGFYLEVLQHFTRDEYNIPYTPEYIPYFNIFYWVEERSVVLTIK